jgi:hypothetical protein
VSLQFVTGDGVDEEISKQLGSHTTNDWKDSTMLGEKYK